MQSCFAVAPDGSQGPPASQCQIIVSEDRTKIRFMGEGRSRADRWYSGYSDIGAPERSVFQLNPIRATVQNNPMLQIADVFSYVITHALSKYCKDEFFKVQLGRVRYWSRSIFKPSSSLQPPHDLPG